jgi:hypothetical protein
MDSKYDTKTEINSFSFQKLEKENTELRAKLAEYEQRKCVSCKFRRYYSPEGNYICARRGFIAFDSFGCTDWKADERLTKIG